MGKFTENLAKAADNAERLVSALEGLPGTDGGTGGGASSVGVPVAPAVARGYGTPTTVVFNTTLEGTGGGGSGSGGELIRSNGSKALEGTGGGGGNGEIIRILRALSASKNFAMMIRTEGL